MRSDDLRLLVGRAALVLGVEEAGESPVVGLDLLDDDVGVLGLLVEDADEGVGELGDDLGFLGGGWRI